jgi:hypothetical protein
MTAFEFPGPERRRSVRTQLAVPVRVRGLTRSGEEFTAEKVHSLIDKVYKRKNS